MNPNIDDRRGHVQQMHANFALEGLLPDSDDVGLQHAYIAGELTLHEMWAYALAFALACAAAEQQQQYSPSGALKAALADADPKRAI